MMKPLSSIIDSHIPQFIRMEYPNFVNFIRAYYEWAEQKGKGYEFIANLQSYIDVDRTSLQLLEHFASLYLEPLPDIIYQQNNIKTLIKNIVQHYQAKGSEKSFAFLFRLIENRDVEFYYPSADMLRISDGKWTMDKSIKIINPPADVQSWMSGQIVGDISHTQAIIDIIKEYDTTTGIHIAELFLQQVDPTKPLTGFIIDETFTGITINGSPFAGTIIPTIKDYTIINPGKYYKKGIRINTSSVTGIDNSSIIHHTSKGAVDGISIVLAGIDYNVDDRLVFTANGFGSGAYGKVSSVDEFGAINGVILLFGGHDYTSIPAIEIISSTGTGAVLMAESDQIGQIVTSQIRNFGIGYTDDDTLSVPTMARIYNRFMDFEIGEPIISSGTGLGIIESHDKINGVIAIRIISGIFLASETITGMRKGATATIYDTSTASLQIEIGSLCQYKGRYINHDSHISSDRYIQDSYFYQVFSYMIKTFIKRSEWFDYVKSVHPAGMISFGYREVPNKQRLIESYIGFFGPTLESTELFKFKWLDGNTQIKQYADITIDTIANIYTKDRDKTNYCFGSEIDVVL